MPTVLISGANRGIGFEFAQQYAAADWTVHATVRDRGDAQALRALGHRVTVHSLDVTDTASIEALYHELTGTAIDHLIANAGISGDLARPVGLIDRQEITEVMAVNTFGPLNFAAAFLPNLRAGELKLCVAISSLMSSIGANDWGTQYVYRASKTALNALWRSLAQEWHAHGIICALMRPGLVRTRMTNFQGDLDASESVGGMRRVMAGLTLADSGRLVGYDGKDVPW